MFLLGPRSIDPVTAGAEKEQTRGVDEASHGCGRAVSVSLPQPPVNIDKTESIMCFMVPLLLARAPVVETPTVAQHTPESG
jgi:hypothetical protein